MSFKFTFREITPEDTEILRMLKLRNAKPEEHICCEILRGDGITMKTWYSKADVTLWGEDYIKANSKMKYIDGDWTVSLDMEPWNRTHGVSSKEVTSSPSPRYPTWLTGHVKEWAQKRLPTVTLCSTTGNELLEVWYYGDLLTLNEEPQLYIVPSYFAPELVTARDPESGEEFVIFDGGRHGYDNMFCEEHDPSELEHRPLKRYEIPASKLVLELGYSIDYEDEKEDFEPDENDTVELISGGRMPWEQIKRDGIDYIALYYVDEQGKQVQILDAELA